MLFIKLFNKSSILGGSIKLSYNSCKHLSIVCSYNVKRKTKLFNNGNSFRLKTSLISKRSHSVPLSKRTDNEKYPSLESLRSNLLRKRAFTENENECAFRVIEPTSSHKNENLRLNSSQNVDQNSSKTYQKFMAICTNSYGDYSVINSLVGCLDKLSTNELTNILQLITSWPKVANVFQSGYYKLWSRLDEELTKRLDEVSFYDKRALAESLNIANLWYKLMVARFCRFNLLLVKKMCSPDLDLNKSELLHLFFYLNLHRVIDEKSKPHLSNRLEKLIDQMTLDEIGVVCMTFFKTQTKLSEKSIRLIIPKVINEMSSQTDNVLRASIFKAIRFSYHFSYKEDVRKLIGASKKLSDHSEIALTHLLLLANEATIYEKGLLDEAFSKLHQDTSAFRPKDIERILLCLSNFNCKLDSNKLEKICEYINNNENMIRYPWYLLTALYYLCLLQFYPKQLIEHCFEPNTLDRIQKTSKLDFQRNLLTINTVLSIEKFSEFGHLLLTPLRINRLHLWILYNEKFTLNHMTKKTLSDNAVYMSLKSEFPSKVKLCHIFPFSSYPIITIFSDQLKNYSFSVTTQLRENMFQNCIAIYILNHKDYIEIDKTVRGATALELRLLSKLGFKVLTMPWHELSRFKTSKGRRNKIMAELEKLK